MLALHSVPTPSRDKTVAGVSDVIVAGVSDVSRVSDVVVTGFLMSK